MSDAYQTVAENLNRLVHEEIYGLAAPMDRVMALVGDKYCIQILHRLHEEGRQRFVELETLAGGISPRTLSARLKHLERYGLVARRPFATIPPRVEYSLSDKGRELARALLPMAVWAEKWYPCGADARSSSTSAS
ncbi:MAG: helix-turn-helix transcriptional regulator [Vampirovibrionales bacterium]|nr:helix-turn-helix transcriptional regulator [Vampirovibrionales bacterium]